MRLVPVATATLGRASVVAATVVTAALATTACARPACERYVRAQDACAQASGAGYVIGDADAWCHDARPGDASFYGCAAEAYEVADCSTDTGVSGASARALGCAL